MQNATRAGLPVAAGHVDALQTVVAASSTVGDGGAAAPPSVKILGAATKGRRTNIQVAGIGSTGAVRRYRVRLGGAVALLAARPSPFTVTLRTRGSRVTVAALDATGRALAAARRRVIRLPASKRDVGRGSGVRG